MNSFKNKVGFYPDILLCLAVLIFSGIISSVYITDYYKKGIKLDFYQNLFGPAVLDTCGKGFKVPLLKEGSRLQEFLYLKKDSFSCEDLQENIPIRVGLSTFTGQTQYLMKLVAWTWSIRGISWSALAPLFSIFYAINIGILYFIFRLGMGRGIAFVGSALISISWVHLTYLPHLRDYSKATFLLALILILGGLVRWGVRRVEIISLSAVFGVVTGIGLGFRQDILICIPPLIMTLFFFLPCGVKSNISAKLGGLFLSFILIGLLGWGPLFSMGHGQNAWHVSLMGLAPNFTESLGLKESIYQWIANHDDKTIQSMASIYSYNKDLVYAFVSTQPYDKITGAYFFEFVKLFPADLLTRVFGSFANIINLSFVSPTYPSPGNESALEVVYRGRQNLIAPFMNWGLWVVVLALLLQSAHKIRFAIFSALFLFYFSAVQTLQFHVRHYFYLEFVFWWSLGFLIYHSWVSVRGPIKSIFLARKENVLWSTILWPKGRWLVLLSRPLKFGGIALLIIMGSIYGLREYQEAVLKEIFSTYAKAEMVPLKWQVISLAKNSNHVKVQGLFAKDSLWPRQNNIAYGFQYLVAEFFPQCESSKKSETVSVKFVLGREDGLMELVKNYTVIVPAKKMEPTRLYYPVHSWSDARGSFTFKGLTLSDKDVPCLKGIYKVKKPLSLSPVNVLLTLPPDWENRALYLSLK